MLEKRKLLFGQGEKRESLSVVRTPASMGEKGVVESSPRGRQVVGTRSHGFVRIKEETKQELKGPLKEGKD